MRATGTEIAIRSGDAPASRHRHAPAGCPPPAVRRRRRPDRWGARPGAREPPPHHLSADPAPHPVRAGLPRTGRLASPVERLADLAAKYRRLQASYQRSLFYAREVRHLYTRLERASLLGLEGLADALDSRDRYTRGHSGRVGAWARQTALALGGASTMLTSSVRRADSTTSARS